MSKDLLFKIFVGVIFGVMLIGATIGISFVLGAAIMYILRTFGWVHTTLNFWQTVLVGFLVSLVFSPLYIKKRR